MSEIDVSLPPGCPVIGLPGGFWLVEMRSPGRDRTGDISLASSVHHVHTRPELASSDSMAWSTAGRREPGCDPSHKTAQRRRWRGEADSGTYRRAGRLAVLTHVDHRHGAPRDQAPVPRRWHRCRPWITGVRAGSRSSSGAAAAVRYDDLDWIGKNSRHDR
jgi:hypothetical protein